MQVNDRPLYLQVVDSLRVDIARKMPGDRIDSEPQLSRRFGVSRPIVCEALGRLQALSLTDARAGRGTCVASSVTKLTITFGQDPACAVR